MQERFTNPAPELSEISDKPNKTIPEHYLEYLTRNQEVLCTTEELLEFHQNLPTAEAATISAIKNALVFLRTRFIPETQRVVTIDSRTEGIHGVVLLPQDRKITSLSEIGVSIFRDEPGKLKVNPRLSVLSKKKLKQNPLVEPGVVISLFDALTEEDEGTHHQSPLLTPTQRKLVALLIEHPGGISVKEFLIGLGIKYFDQTALKLVETHLSWCRAKMKDGLRIYHLPAKLKEKKVYLKEKRKYILMDRREIGEKIHIPVVGEDELTSLPQLAREAIDNLCNLLTAHSERELRSSVTPMQRCLLLYLAHHFGFPCSTRYLTDYLLPDTLSLPSYVVNIRALKTGLQRALQGSELAIFTLFEYFGGQEGMYVLLPRDFFQGKERKEVPLVSPKEFIKVDERIRPSIQKMCNWVRVKDFSLYPVFGGKERGLLRALAESFPRGRGYQSLIREFFPDCQLPLEALQDRMNKMRKKILKEFGEEISIRRVSKGYVLELTKEGQCIGIN